MITYVQNAVKPIKLMGAGNVRVILWGTGQVLTLPVAILEEEYAGELKAVIAKLKAEAIEFALWGKDNG